MPPLFSGGARCTRLTLAKLPPQIGSGQGFGKAGYIKNIQAVASSNILKLSDGVVYLSDPASCYEPILVGVYKILWALNMNKFADIAMSFMMRDNREFHGTRESFISVTPGTKF